MAGSSDFIAAVTRYAKKSGVALRAQVFGPNKAISKTCDFHITVKGNGLTDYECCVIDLAELLSNIEKTGINLLNLNSNIGCLANAGNNGTTIRYEIIDDENNTESLSDYFHTENGGVIDDKKPKPQYGEKEVSGYLKITVSKGIESIINAQTHIVIQPYSSDEAINAIASMPDIKEYIWNVLKGTDADAGTNATTKLRHITADLNSECFNSSPITLENIINNPKSGITQENINMINNIIKNPSSVSITFNITDDLSVNFGGARINSNGTINKSISSYDKTYNAILSDNGRHSGMFIDSGQPGIIYGGINISAILKLDSSMSNIDYDCCVASSRITGKEIIDYVKNNITDMAKYFIYAIFSSTSNTPTIRDVIGVYSSSSTSSNTSLNYYDSTGANIPGITIQKSDTKKLQIGIPYASSISNPATVGAAQQFVIPYFEIRTATNGGSTTKLMNTSLINVGFGASTGSPIKLYKPNTTTELKGYSFIGQTQLMGYNASGPCLLGDSNSITSFKNSTANISDENFDTRAFNCYTLDDTSMYVVDNGLDAASSRITADLCFNIRIYSNIESTQVTLDIPNVKVPVTIENV